MEPAHPRRVASLLSIGESDASRRLRRLTDVGMVDAAWERVDGRNIKRYRLVVDDLSIQIRGEGLAIATGEDGSTAEGDRLLETFRPQVPEPSGFVGRREELAALEGPDPVVVLEGIAGIGKTSLAAAWAHESEQPAFFHGFSGTESLTWLAHRVGLFQAAHGDRELLEAVEAGATLADQRQLLLEALTDTSTACVLDAVERIRDENVEALVSEAIEQVDEARLVVVGRKIPSFDPTVDHVRRLRLSGLPSDDVAELLAEADLEAGPDVAERVQRRLGGHPLAVTLFAQTAREAEQPVESLLAGVPDEEIEAYLLEEVAEHLSGGERRALTYASVFRGPFRTDDLDAIHPSNPRGALVKLRRRRLLRGDGDAYRMHDLLSSFFEQRLEDPASVHAEAAEHALSKGTLEARLDALYHLLEAGERRRVLGLLEEDLDLEEFDLIEEGYHNLYLDVLQRLDPDQVADGHRAGLVHDELGDIRHHRGEHEQALDHYRHAAEHFQAIGAQQRLADLAWKRGLVFRETGQPERARRQVQAGLEEHDPDERTAKRLAALASELDAA